MSYPDCTSYDGLALLIGRMEELGEEKARMAWNICTFMKGEYLDSKGVGV